MLRRTAEQTPPAAQILEIFLLRLVAAQHRRVLVFSVAFTEFTSSVSESLCKCCFSETIRPWQLSQAFKRSLKKTLPVDKWDGFFNQGGIGWISSLFRWDDLKKKNLWFMKDIYHIRLRVSDSYPLGSIWQSQQDVYRIVSQGKHTSKWIKLDIQ